MVLARTFDIAAITGATSGIGAAFAEALPALTGLLLTGRREAQLRAAAEHLGQPNQQVDVIVADLPARAHQDRDVP